MSDAVTKSKQEMRRLRDGILNPAGEIRLRFALEQEPYSTDPHKYREDTKLKVHDDIYNIATGYSRFHIGSLDDYARICFDASVAGGWWQNSSGTPKLRNKPEMIALMHSELSEALEGIRKNAKDDHLPQFDSVDVELADLFIRLMDFCGGFGIDLERAVLAKLLYNLDRSDHKPENRNQEGGKQF